MAAKPGQKLYAQEDLRLDEKTTIKRGDVLAELPPGVTLAQIVEYSTTGRLAIDKPHERVAAADGPADAHKPSAKPPQASQPKE